MWKWIGAATALAMVATAPGCRSVEVVELPENCGYRADFSLPSVPELRIAADQVEEFRIRKGIEQRQWQLPDGSSLSYCRYVHTSTDRPEQPWRLVLFLHGAGERGSDNVRQLWHCIPELVDTIEARDLNAVVLVPQCPEAMWWSGSESMLHGLAALVRQTGDEYKIPPGLRSFAGISMGAFGGYPLLNQNPELFGRALLICGGAEPEDLSNLTAMPLWICHGAADSVVPVAASRKVVKELLAQGSETVLYSELPDVEHNSWIYAFNHESILNWLLYCEWVR